MRERFLHRLGQVSARLAMLFLASAPLAAAEDAPGGFATKANQAYVIEASTGTVLLAKGERDLFSPASLAKLMTLDLVFDALKTGQLTPATDYGVSEFAWRTGGAPSRAATMFAALKSRVPVDALVKGVAVQGANDACIILSEGMSGGETAFAESMNVRARSLGMSRTVFTNSTGLPDGNRSRTSVEDMVKLARHLQSAYPESYPLFAAPEFEWNKIRQRNRNPLLGLDIGADGLMTGFAEGEGYSIVASATRDGKRIFMALAGLASDKERTEEARRVLEWGLGSFQLRQIFAGGEIIGTASVYGGAGGGVDLVAKEPISVFLPISNPDRVAATIVYHWPLRAPVAANAEVASLRLFTGGRLLREVPLYTARAVEQGSLSSRAADALLEMAEKLLFSWTWHTDTAG